MPQTISANNARRYTLPLVVVPCLRLPATFVIAWTDTNPGGNMFSTGKLTQIAAHLRDKAHRCHCLHAWMCHQDLHHLLIRFHLRCDLCEERLASMTLRDAYRRRGAATPTADAVGSGPQRLLAVDPVC